MSLMNSTTTTRIGQRMPTRIRLEIAPNIQGNG